MNPVMCIVTGALLFANTIIALPYGGDGKQFPTTEEVIQRLSTLEYRLILKILQHTGKSLHEHCHLRMRSNQRWSVMKYFYLFIVPK